MPKVRLHCTALLCVTTTHSLHETNGTPLAPRTIYASSTHADVRASICCGLCLSATYPPARPLGRTVALSSICMYVYEYFTAGEEEPTYHLKTKLAEMEAKNDAAMTEVRALLLGEVL
jgi:hypothetical protein